MYTFSNMKTRKSNLSKLDPTKFLKICIWINSGNLTIDVIIILNGTSQKNLGSFSLFYVGNSIQLNHSFLKLLKKRNWAFSSSMFCFVDYTIEMYKKMNFFHLYYFFHVKTLFLHPFPIRVHSSLHFLNKFLAHYHIQIEKIERCKKFVYFFVYKFLVYNLLKFVSPFHEIAIDTL